MEDLVNSNEKGTIDVRYCKRFWISMFAGAGGFLVITLLSGPTGLFWLIYCIVFVLIFVGLGIYSLTGGKALSLDKTNKVLHKYIFYGLTSSKYKYDRLFFKGNKLYREIDGKVKFIELRSIDYNKNDLEILNSEIRKG
jgi:hypothetical protein